jgi:hypothetical protein
MWAKSYTTSVEFNTEYEAMRNARKPAAPLFDGTPEDEVQRILDLQTAEIERSKATLASVDPETRKQMEAALGQAAAAMRQLDTPEMRNRQLAGIRYMRDAATEKYKAALQWWESDYPQDPSRLIARRLKLFLEVSADVDYDAALVERDGAMVFLDARYERKSREWKLCYRAGKGVVDAARSAATAWLKEIGSGKTGSEHP